VCENFLEWLVFCDWLVKVAFFVGQTSNSKIVFILGRREYLEPGDDPTDITCLVFPCIIWIGATVRG
jgi:hypothetical protein